jgi:hypothetical protein
VSDEKFYVQIAERLGMLRKMLNETPYIEHMPTSQEEWEEFGNLVSKVWIAGNLCGSAMDVLFWVPPSI